MSGLHVYRNSCEAVIANSLGEAWDILLYDYYLYKYIDPIVQLPDDSNLTILEEDKDSYNDYEYIKSEETRTCNEWLKKGVSGKIGIVKDDYDDDESDPLVNWLEQNSEKASDSIDRLTHTNKIGGLLVSISIVFSAILMVILPIIVNYILG